MTGFGMNLEKGGLLMNFWELFWAIAFVAFVVAEFATVQLVSIWFAAGALVTVIVTHFTDISVLGQLGVFIAVSAVLLAITFPIIRKKNNSKITATNSELDIGKNASVIEEINVDAGTGRIALNGVNWSAVPENTDEIIPVGSIVTVKEVKGATLTVALKSEINA